MRLLSGVSSILLASNVWGRPQDESSPNSLSMHGMCQTRDCVMASADLFNNMNTSVDPCVDFNQYACGQFINNQVIPDDRGRLTAFTPASEEIYKRAKHLMDNFGNDGEAVWKSDTMAKKLYESCMNQTRIEEVGLTQVKGVLSKLGGWPVIWSDWSDDGFEWYDYTIKSLELGLGISYIMVHTVGQDIKNISYRVVKVDQPSLGLSREYLIKGFEDKDVQHYYNYMVESAKLMGAEEEQAKTDMKEALLFEIKLAEASTAREFRRDPNSRYNPVTLGEFESPAGFPPSMKDYLNRIFVAGKAESVQLGDDEKVIINDPDYFKKVSNVLTTTSKRTMANYLGWRIYKSQVGKLNKAARDLKQDYVKALRGIAKASPDWKRCLSTVGFNSFGGMAGLAGSMYVRKYFKPEEKAAVEEMISYIRAAFHSMLEKVEWMDDKTKERAKEKLNKMDQFIAYPDELLDQKIIDDFYAPLESLSSDNFLQNMLNIDKFDTARVLKQLRDKIDPKHWTEHQIVALVNAFYNPDINSMEFPAGILQGAFYNSKRPNYMNFGAIGAVIGHEITHGFDDQGRTQDYEGKLVDWWEGSTSKEYKKRAQCVIDQYGSYEAEQIGITLNGINTQGENIADNGGIKEAYLGFLNYAKDHPQEQLPGHSYTPNQMFWISFGQVWCSKFKDGQLKSQILTGVHSPGEFRIRGPLSNNPDFARDFNCPAGSPMNPVNKCTVW